MVLLVGADNEDDNNDDDDDDDVGETFEFLAAVVSGIRCCGDVRIRCL